jgi:CheY-like chemotaxis protein
MQKYNHVLLIDDDEDDRWLFSEAVARTVPAALCTTAPGGQEALNILVKTLPLPDIIFLDLNMPGMDGKRCLMQLKKDPTLNHIPVIIYSTSNFHKDIEDAIRLGAADFVIKPSDFNHLCSLVKKLLG